MQYTPFSIFPISLSIILLYHEQKAHLHGELDEND